MSNLGGNTSHLCAHIAAESPELRRLSEQGNERLADEHAKVVKSGPKRKGRLAELRGKKGVSLVVIGDLFTPPKPKTIVSKETMLKAVEKAKVKGEAVINDRVKHPNLKQGQEFIFRDRVTGEPISRMFAANMGKGGICGY